MKMSARRLQNYAVVKLEQSGSIRVVKVHYLIGFQPIWRSDPTSWPTRTTLEDEENEELDGAVVQILKIDEQQSCLDHVERLENNTGISKVISNQVESLQTNVTTITEMVRELQLQVKEQQRKINELSDALAYRAGEQVIYQVGIHKISVEARSLAESSVQGLLDIKGFSHLLKKVIDPNLFDSNYTWQNLDRITQEKIGDLLALYVIHGYASKCPGQTLDFESATNTFYTIYKQLVHKFQNGKCKYTKQNRQSSSSNAANSNCDSTSIEPSMMLSDCFETSHLSFKRARTARCTVRKISKANRAQIKTHFDNLGELKDPRNVDPNAGVPDFEGAERQMLEALASGGTAPVDIHTKLYHQYPT